MHQPTIDQPFNRLLLTGAAGRLGKLLRRRVQPWTRVLRLSDVSGVGPAGAGEEVMECDLADRDAVLRMAEGVDAVIHFGGISYEKPFQPIMQANILGMANLYEAVHKAGVRRVVFASSSHVTGFYDTTQRVDTAMPYRPDTFYGISKCFGELMSRYYFDRFGIETVCLRIGSCFPEPQEPSDRVMHLPEDDLVELVRCALFAPRVGHTILYATSDNDQQWWDSQQAAHLGFKPRQSSRPFARRFPDTAPQPARDDSGAQYQGGMFVSLGPQY
jgi:uronate dehydrogenase